MKIIPGGYKLVEFSSSPTFATVTEIIKLLKAGTSLVPKTPTEEMADGTSESVLKQMDMNIRSADVDNAAGSAYALLKAAELAGTAQNFRFIGLSNGILIDGCESGWTASQIDVTVTHDTDCKAGTKSLKMAVGADADPDALASKNVGSVDLSTRKGISKWVKSSVALNAGDVRAKFNYAAWEEIFSFPAILANTWTKCNFALADPSKNVGSMTASIEMVNDKGAFDLFVDDIRAIADNVVVKDVIPKVDFEYVEIGKANAIKITGEGIAATEASLLENNY